MGSIITNVAPHLACLSNCTSVLVTEGSRRVEQHPTKFPGCSASRRTFPSRCPCPGRTAVDTLRLHYSRLLPHNEAKHDVRYVLRCQDSQASGGGGTGCTPSSCGCASECRCLQRRPGTGQVTASNEAQRASTSALGADASA